MGKTKYLRDVLALFEKSPIVNYDSIKRIIYGKKKAGNYTKKLIYVLLSKGKIKRLAKGIYTNKDDISLSVFGFEPSYLGLQNAMSLHNLWEQETIPIIITIRKIRTGIRVVFGGNVLVRKIDKRYLFGFEYYKDGDFYLPYSDIEKTFIDMVYFKEHMDDEVIDNFKEKINMKKLRDYLNRYPLRFRKMVLRRLKKEYL